MIRRYVVTALRRQAVSRITRIITILQHAVDGIQHRCVVRVAADYPNNVFTYSSSVSNSTWFFKKSRRSPHRNIS